MIYTLTCNPCIDYIMQLDGFRYGHNNRSNSEQYLPSGKGINVSLMLEKLGMESIALGFLGGLTGKALLSMLEQRNLKSDFIWLEKGLTRINVKLKIDEETEINSNGPYIGNRELEALHQQLHHLTNSDVLFLSGSLAKGMPKDFYANIMKDTKATVILDTLGQPLLECLKYHPFVIKPNQDELGELFGLELTSDHEIIHYAKKLQEKGARHVLVSLGKNGAILVSEDKKVYRTPGIEGVAINTMCAGDSMLAGFTYSLLKGNNIKESLRLANACGAATAFSNDLGEVALVNQLVKVCKVYEVIEE